MQSVNYTSGAPKPKTLTRQYGQRNLFNPIAKTSNESLLKLRVPPRRNIYAPSGQNAMAFAPNQAGNEGGEYRPIPQSYINAQGAMIRRSGGSRTRARKTNRNLKKSKKSRTRKARR